MEVIVIAEECHGLIGIAANLKAAKQWLIHEGWVDGGTDFWSDAYKSSSLKELYGENWKEVYMNFDEEDMECMGFYLDSRELIEETDCGEPDYEDEDEEDE